MYASDEAFNLTVVALKCIIFSVINVFVMKWLWHVKFVLLFPQIQDVVPVSSYDTTGSFLLLGCDNGCIYNIG